MVTFLSCFILLVASYFTYGKFLQWQMGKYESEMPSKRLYDGIDYIPMPTWKNFLIQLLNIAGLGPIFGAVLGATYGPVAFLWITFGGIFIGAMHDYISGVISLRNDGLSYPEIVGKYLGNYLKQIARFLTFPLMVLVGAVFMVGPANLLNTLYSFDLPGLEDVALFANPWIYIILAYYFLATLLPIDKIIGRIYPLFGLALILMALGMLGVLLFDSYKIPELTVDTFRNMKADSEAFPLMPTLFITIACGAISGFHATQSPMVARCMTSVRYERMIFFGAMISECLIALIWAAIAMAFFGGVDKLGVALAEHGNDAAWAINEISETTLGRFGAYLVLLGVVAAPISTGDTAFRSARLIFADIFSIDQRSIYKCLYICIPIFVIGFVITLLPFDVIWRYFAWVNQLLAVCMLWCITAYLAKNKKCYIYAMLPAMFMSFVAVDYLLVSPQLLGLPYFEALIISAYVVVVLVQLFFKHNINNREVEPVSVP